MLHISHSIILFVYAEHVSEISEKIMLYTVYTSYVVILCIKLINKIKSLLTENPDLEPTC